MTLREQIAEALKNLEWDDLIPIDSAIDAILPIVEAKQQLVDAQAEHIRVLEAKVRSLEYGHERLRAALQAEREAFDFYEDCPECAQDRARAGEGT